MNVDHRLATPESVAITYELAGIGTRFLAALVDTLIGVILLAIILAGSEALLFSQGGGLTLAIIVGLTLFFILFWGYFIVFETLWSGQTPGKRMLKIRVIKASGYPVAFADTAIRNVVRIVDFLPGLYGVGVVVMFAGPEPRRLGDYVAGTVVVKERQPVELADLAVSEHRRMTAISPRGAIDPEELDWDLERLTPQELELVRQYLQRVPALDWSRAMDLGRQIATPIAARIGSREPYDPVRFLQRVLDLAEGDRPV